MTAIFWPLLVPVLLIHMLKNVIKFMLKETGIIIKGIRIFYTTIIFLIAAAIIHKEKEEEKPATQQANDEGEIINKLDRAKKVIRDEYIKDCDTCQDYSIDWWNAPYKREADNE